MDCNKNIPKCILLFSGKRKSGKDYFTDKLLESVDRDKVAIIKISAPIKSHFAKKYQLNLNELMSDSHFKEKFRAEMIDWSDGERAKDPGVFCRSAVDMYTVASHHVWIVSDVRRKTDISWFKQSYGGAVKTIRISADDTIRIQRGWKFTPGVDDVQSECDLDDLDEWDWVFENNNNSENFNNFLTSILNHIKMVT